MGIPGHGAVWSADTAVWNLDWIPHLSSGKLVLIIATFLALVFGFDDVIGPARTNAWAASWLSVGTRFFRSLIRGVRDSASMLRIVIVVWVATTLEAILLFTAFWFFGGSGKWWMDAIRYVLFLLAVVVALALGYGLQDYFESADVANFLRDRSEYVEIRIMQKISAAITTGVEETERSSFRQTPTGLPSTPYEVSSPLVTIMSAISLATTLIFILSFVTRSVRFLISAAIWLLVFAPALGLNAMARRTGAENYIKVGKYVVLVIMSIYGLFHA